jgi:hypothetical protein
MIFQSLFPPLPDFPINPPSTVEQLFACIISVLLLFETVVLVLPEKWRDRISVLQFGPHWNPNRKGDQ